MLPEMPSPWNERFRGLVARARRALRSLAARAYADRARLSRLALLFACVALLPGLVQVGVGAARAGHAAGTPPLGAMAPTATPGAPGMLPPEARPGDNAIRRENALPGTNDWVTPTDKIGNSDIQAYAGATSVVPGGDIAFYVSVRQAGGSVRMRVYRLGWYGGAGGRLVAGAQAPAQAQGYYDVAAGKLVGCGSCRVDGGTGLVEADWRPTFRVAIPGDWVTGVYFAQFRDDAGHPTGVTFDVLGDPRAPYVVVTTDTTVQAYNEWGGYSLYLARHPIVGARGVKVSFDRPVAGWGTVQGLLYEIDGIRWLERKGYDASYISSVDLHERPSLLLDHRALLDFGHDEYWSKEMRDGIEHARDAGIGLAFVGANTGFWQIRFEPDGAGGRDRTIVCYRQATRDPMYAKDRSRVTVEWRSPVLGRPENGLLGEMYSDWTSPLRGFSWRLRPDARSPLLDGTSLQPGQWYGCDLVGYEWDKVYPNGASPRDLRVLSDSPVGSVTGKADHSNTTYYVAGSGALVFDAGSIKWDFALDDLRLQPDRWCMSRHAAIPGMQKLFANVLAALVVRQTP